MEGIGAKIWLVPDGLIPLESTGKEPWLLSQDRISILNTNKKEANFKIVVYYQDEEPVGEYKLKVKAQRLRKIRINDIIDPFPVPLQVPYSLKIVADSPVVVQFFRMHTGAAELSIMGGMAYGA
jgi:hypothetical protein